VGWTPDTVDVIVHTHLHFDHCYNTRKCPGAEVVVQRAEYEFSLDPAPFSGIYRPELVAGSRLTLVDGPAQVAPGVDLLPSPGHSPGGQSVIVATDRGRVAIAGLCTCDENFDPPVPHPMAGDEQTLLPGIMINARQAYESIQRLRRTADVILPLHEPRILNLTRIPD
jgi:N-acyl homoserine lactone hydrolase